MRSGLPAAAILALLAGVGLLLSRAGSPDRARSDGIVIVRSAPPRQRPAEVTLPAPPHALRSAPKPESREWAAASEALLRVQFRQVPMLDVADNLRISCASPRCEVAARLPAGLEGDNRAMYWRFIQGPAVRERMVELGLPLDRAELGTDDRFVLGFGKGA